MNLEEKLIKVKEYQDLIEDLRILSNELSQPLFDAKIGGITINTKSKTAQSYFRDIKERTDRLYEKACRELDAMFVQDET